MLSDTYYFPAYNNVNLDEQLRFGNVGGADTTVTVTIGGVVRGTYFLHPNEQKRVNYPGLDSGPVVVSSSGGVKIIAAIRDAWTPHGRQRHHQLRSDDGSARRTALDQLLLPGLQQRHPR